MSSTSESCSLSLHDALPISLSMSAACRSTSAHRLLHASTRGRAGVRPTLSAADSPYDPSPTCQCVEGQNKRSDRKSTRLNSSHMSISYAVFCLKKKTLTHIL